MTDVDKMLADILDPAGETKALANKLGNILLSADPDRAYSALVAATALVLAAGPDDLTADNAVALAADLGRHVAQQLTEEWDGLREIFRKHAAGEFRSLSADEVRTRTLTAIKVAAGGNPDDVRLDATLGDLGIDDNHSAQDLAHELEMEFSLYVLGHGWSEATTVGEIIDQVDAKVAGIA